MRGRMAGMRLLIQGVLLLADAVDDSDSHVSSWRVVFAALMFMGVCWFILSVMSKGKKTSLWQDDNSEMDSGPLGHD
jgi:hypothetical protein